MLWQFPHSSMKECPCLLYAVAHVCCMLWQFCNIRVTGPQLPNCRTQCQFSWLVVSPLRQTSTRSGNLVLAGILAFYAVKTASLSPPLGPLATSISALRTGTAPQASSWWTWAPTQPTRCLYLQVIRPSQVFSVVIYAQ